MPFSIDEGRLRFLFDDRWSDVKKYDDHPDFLRKIRKISGTKALDLVAVRGEDGPLFLIEIKDYRGLPLERQASVLEEDLPTIIARKVRDTIAGIVAAHHRGQVETWGSIVKRLISPEPAVRVLCWIETDFPGGPRGRPSIQLAVLTDRLRKELAWSTAEVLVVNLAARGAPGGLSVAEIPGIDPRHGPPRT